MNKSKVIDEAIRWSALLVLMGCCYTLGYMSCDVMHVSKKEQDKMWYNEKDELSVKRYIIEAFKDFPRSRKALRK